MTRPDPVIIILAACQPLGLAAANAFASQGARVIAIDDNPTALATLAATNPEAIEALAIEDLQRQLVPMLQNAWGSSHLDMVINLSPLANPRDISGQMHMLSAILRTTVRGLVTARGALVSVVVRPKDRLALVGQGMQAAVQSASAGLGVELAKNQVRVHCVAVPKEDSLLALETLLFLASEAGRRVHSTALDLGGQAG